MNLFGNTEINITTEGKRRLVQDCLLNNIYMHDKVMEWRSSILRFADIATTSCLYIHRLMENGHISFEPSPTLHISYNLLKIRSISILHLNLLGETTLAKLTETYLLYQCV